MRTGMMIFSAAILCVFSALSSNAQSSGEFAAPTTFSAGVPMIDFEAIDCLGSPHPELFCFTTTGIQLIDRHDPSGVASVFLSTPTKPRSVAVGDIDQDGDRDVVVACALDTPLTFVPPTTQIVLFTAGPTGFSSSTLTQPASSAYGAIHLRDIDADGLLDIVHGSGVRWNLGNGTFGAPVVVATGATPAESHPGDFDGDGDQDILFIAIVGGNIQIQVMQKIGTQSFTPRPVVSVPGSLHRSVVARMDGGNRDDLLMVVHSGSKRIVQSFLGSASGSVASQSTFEFTGMEFVASSRLRVIDFDGDGDQDAAIGIVDASSGNKKTILLNTGFGTFSPQSGAGLYATGTLAPLLFAVGDEDQNGKPDLIGPTATNTLPTTIETALNIPPSSVGPGMIDIDENFLPFQSIGLSSSFITIVARLLIDPTTAAVGRVANVAILTPATGTFGAPNFIADALGNILITIATTAANGALTVRITTPDGATLDQTFGISPTVQAVTTTVVACAGSIAPPLVARMVGSSGAPVPGVPLTFDPPFGPNVLVTTDANGYATWTPDLTAYPPGNYVVQCGTWIALTASINLTVSNQYAVLPATGSGQIANSGQMFASPLSVNFLGCGAGPGSFPNVTFAVTSTPTSALSLSATTVTPTAAGVAPVFVTAAPDSVGAHTVVASIGGAPVATFNLFIRRLRTAKVATNVFANYSHEHGAVPLMFAVDTPLPAPGYVATPVGNVATSILAPLPSLFVLDGIGIYGVVDGTLTTSASGSWARLFSMVPALGGTTFVFQVYGYDPFYTGIDAYFVSNATTLLL